MSRAPTWRTTSARRCPRTPSASRGTSRVNTGFAETYAHAIFPNDAFPEHKYRKLYLPALSPLCDIIDFTNDILSFYKETIRGTERINYICNVANTTGSSALRCLQETVDAVESRVLEIHRILAPYPDLLAHCNDYLGAYIGWHIRTTSRYFLDEVRFMAWVNVTELVEPTPRSVPTKAKAQTNGAMPETNTLVAAGGS